MSNAMAQVIDAQQAYTVAEFKRRTGMADYAFKRARRDGLRVVEVGRKRYVRGVDWLAHLERAAEEQQA